MEEKQEVLISIKNLNKEFKGGGRTVHAVNNVSLDIYKGDMIKNLFCSYYLYYNLSHFLKP